MALTRLMRGELGLRVLLWRDAARGHKATERMEVQLEDRLRACEEALTEEMVAQAGVMADRFARLEAKAKGGAVASLRLVLTRVAKGELAMRVALWQRAWKEQLHQGVEATMAEAVVNEEALSLALADQGLLRETVEMLQDKLMKLMEREKALQTGKHAGGGLGTRYDSGDHAYYLTPGGVAQLQDCRPCLWESLDRLAQCESAHSDEALSQQEALVRASSQGEGAFADTFQKVDYEWRERFSIAQGIEAALDRFMRSHEIQRRLAILLMAHTSLYGNNH